MLHFPALSIVKRLFPLRYSAEEMSTPIAGLQMKYRKYTLLTIVLFFMLTPVCIYASYLAIRSYAGVTLPVIAGPIHAIRIDDDVLTVFAIFPGITLACCLIAVLGRLMLGVEGSREYRILSNRLAEMNATNAYISIGILSTGCSLLVAVFALQSGIFLGHDDMVLVRMWNWQEERYRYDQIKALREVWDDKGSKWDFVMRLDGAPDWSTAQEVVFPDAEQKALLVQRTGRPIETVTLK